MQDNRTIYPTLNRDLARLHNAHSNCVVAAWRHAQFPIEGAGVVHVVTELPDGDPGYGYSDITLARYATGDLLDHAPLTGSVCEGAMAGFMHEHWCNIGRLIACVRGNTKALFILDIDWEIGDDDVDEGHFHVQEGESELPDPGLTPMPRS